MDAQQEHDLEMSEKLPRLKESLKGSHARLKASLAKKGVSSSDDAPSIAHDPIEQAMARHPGLTRERAEADAKAWGF
jgi:hypothetical protein